MGQAPQAARIASPARLRNLAMRSYQSAPPLQVTADAHDCPLELLALANPSGLPSGLVPTDNQSQVRRNHASFIVAKLGWAGFAGRGTIDDEQRQNLVRRLGHEPPRPWCCGRSRPTSSCSQSLPVLGQALCSTRLLGLLLVEQRGAKLCAAKGQTGEHPSRQFRTPAHIRTDAGKPVESPCTSRSRVC